MIKKIIGIVILAGLALFVVIQLIPFGRNYDNPPVVQDTPWGSPEAEAIARRSCYDCHSNETTWPWYSKVAPMSWLAQNDIREGRRALNFSTWGQGEFETGEIAGVIRQGSMPPLQYTLLHPTAKLSASEKETLIQGLPGSTGGFNENEGNEGNEGGEGGG